MRKERESQTNIKDLRVCSSVKDVLVRKVRAAAQIRRCDLGKRSSARLKQREKRRTATEPSIHQGNKKEFEVTREEPPAEDKTTSQKAKGRKLV